MAQMKKYPIIDFYFSNPILCDFILITILGIFGLFVYPYLIQFGFPIIKIFSREVALNYMSYLTSATVTLIGFIIAALTILITVKSSLKARGFEDAKNAMEYLFSTDTYHHIVEIFIKSIVELFILFVVLYISWLVEGNLVDKCFYFILSLSTFGVFTAVFRVLYTLFSVLKLEKLPRV